MECRAPRSGWRGFLLAYLIFEVLWGVEKVVERIGGSGGETLTRRKPRYLVRSTGAFICWLFTTNEKYFLLLFIICAHAKVMAPRVTKSLLETSSGQAF